ncbi:hypothetical protein KM043_006742 [Ampulex compressa]|nr:hypothetical protein KM043_006742 [Ampulex compressa]
MERRRALPIRDSVGVPLPQDGATCGFVVPRRTRLWRSVTSSQELRDIRWIRAVEQLEWVDYGNWRPEMEILGSAGGSKWSRVRISVYPNSSPKAAVASSPYLDQLPATWRIRGRRVKGGWKLRIDLEVAPTFVFVQVPRLGRMPLQRESLEGKAPLMLYL